MSQTFIERQIETAVQEAAGDAAARAMKGIKWLAAMQGGSSAIENYKLLGKRVLIVAGVVVAVQAAASVVGYVITRRREDKRIEQIARRIIAEERQAEDEAQVRS